jgi:hypothetical protein
MDTLIEKNGVVCTYQTDAKTKVVRLYNDVPVGITVDSLEKEINFLDKQLFKIALSNYNETLDNVPWKELRDDSLYNLSINNPHITEELPKDRNLFFVI